MIVHIRFKTKELEVVRTFLQKEIRRLQEVVNNTTSDSKSIGDLQLLLYINTDIEQQLIDHIKRQ